MSEEEEVEREIERLADVLIPHLCERTGLSRMQVENFLNVIEEFWDNQPHVMGRLFVLGFEIENPKDSYGG